MATITKAELKVLTSMSATDFDALDGLYSGFMDQKILVATSEIESRLRKRYAVPFVEVPNVVKGWLEALITPELYLKRGMDPQNSQLERHFAAAERAREQMKEAADSVEGLYDLPLLNAGDASAIARGGPLGYAEASPYSWTDEQAEAIRNGS